MFENAVLARPELSVDARHDGRHQLDPSRAFNRESIPIIVNLPEHGIAFFTYTWVNAQGEAGAAIAIFGPGVGPEPIQARLADRPVPAEMDFSDWRIDGFSMKQDLKWGRAEVTWDSPQATFDFVFEGYHPPYAYSANAEGCPLYCADDRIEQSGRVKGTVRIGDRTIEFDGFGHRDHSWGTRDWVAFQNYRWCMAQAADNTSVHFWHLHALGSTKLLGYVFKDGMMAEVTGLDFSWTHDEAFLQRSLDATLTDEKGRTTRLAIEFTGHYPLIPHPNVTLMEGNGRAVIDGKQGVGWVEVAWPTDYLAHIRAVPLYAQEAGKDQ